MPEQDKLEELTLNVNRYVKTNIELVKLEATERASVFGSKLIADLTILIVFFLLILFASIGAGFYISNKLGDNYSGFISVAGFYLIISILLMLVKKGLLEKYFQNKIINKVFSKK